MAIYVTELRSSLEESDEALFARARKAAGLSPSQVKAAYLAKRSVDARRQNQSSITLVNSVCLEVLGDEEALVRRAAKDNVRLQKAQPLTVEPGSKPLEQRPVVVGFGPAGMFAGLLLARLGYEPLILERGQALEGRVEAVEAFWQKGQLDPDCNVQFGEGGAGTFSDGKLTTRISDARCAFVLEELVRHGAPEQIRYEQKPHVGTDLLRQVVRSIRQEILQQGGEVRFGCRVEGLLLRQGRLEGLKTSQGDVLSSQVILALGHSARDTFETLLGQGVQLEPKPFSVGFRAEQPQALIDRGLYGRWAGHPALPKGEYQLSQRQGDRGVYTFCMCPGGVVVPASSEAGGIVTNGMSYFARDGVNANAAVVVSVDQRDYGPGPLAGLAFQRRLERKAFELAGRSYAAPAQSAVAYLGGKLPLERCGAQPRYDEGNGRDHVYCFPWAAVLSRKGVERAG